MPVNPSRLRGKYADATVALAGPLTNLLLAAIALIALTLWVPLCEGQLISSVSIAHPLSTNLETFFHLGAMLNIVLMLFNLLPVPPLDGGRILMDVVPPYRRMMSSENGRWIGLGIFIIFFIFVSPWIFVFAIGTIGGLTELFWAIFFPKM